MHKRFHRVLPFCPVLAIHTCPVQIDLFTNVYGQINRCFFHWDLATSHFINLYLIMVFHIITWNPLCIHWLLLHRTNLRQAFMLSRTTFVQMVWMKLVNRSISLMPQSHLYTATLLLLLGDMYIVHITYCICTNLYSSILFITVQNLFLDYLKNPIPNHFQISSVSLPWSGIDTLSFSAWSLNHDVI